MLDIAQINKDWTLFLDRDGVINDDKSPYTLNAEQFDFYPGVPEAIADLGKIFKYVIITTNQRGVGRNLMTENDLQLIHDKLQTGVTAAGGSITAIYYCTAINNDHPNRKPNPGMAFQAMQDYKDIDPARTIIVGNNISDMQFGRNAGIHTVLVHSTGTKVNEPHELVDLQFENLPAFAEALKKVKGNNRTDNGEQRTN